MAVAPTGPQERQKPVGTARKGAHKASFAIREPQPAGLSLKASLQQLRGTTNSSQAPGGREKPAEDAIMSNAEEERQSHSSPLPSPPQAVLHTPIPGIASIGPQHLDFVAAWHTYLGRQAILKERASTAWPLHSQQAKLGR